MITLAKKLGHVSGASRERGALVRLAPPAGRRLFSLLAAVAALAGSTANAQNFRTGTVAERYTLLCANCHGKNLEGSGTGPSLLKDTWLHGGDDESIAKSIRTGFPEKGMPVWGAAIPERKSVPW